MEFSYVQMIKSLYLQNQSIFLMFYQNQLYYLEEIVKLLLQDNRVDPSADNNYGIWNEI